MNTDVFNKNTLGYPQSFLFMHKSLLFFPLHFFFCSRIPGILATQAQALVLHKCTTGSFPWGTCDSLLFHPSAPDSFCLLLKGATSMQ